MTLPPRSPSVAYLACPFNHPDAQVRRLRAETVTRAAAELMRRGILVFSPITHNVPLLNYGLTSGWNNWREYDRTMLERCDKIIVLKIDGWESSTGVQNEIRIATERGMPVEYLNPDEICLTPMP